MNITAKTLFGLRTLMDIAFHDKGGPVQRRHIALRQGIPTDYMDQLLMRLRNHGFVHSFRGREGGYHLAVDPEAVTVWDIVQAVEDEGYVAKDAPSVPADCSYAVEHVTEPAVDFVSGIIERQLKKYTLAMFLEEADDRLLEAGMDPFEIVGKKPDGNIRRKKAPNAVANDRAYVMRSEGHSAMFH